MDRYKKLLWLIFKEKSEGCDIYHNSGSIWLILTDEKKWVIELTKDGTLWYNYHFFKDCFRLLSLDVIKNQHYITEWVESTIQNGVRSTLKYRHPTPTTLESIIQNGVKETSDWRGPIGQKVEDTIQNGVKETKHQCLEGDLAMEEVIQNGIKETIDQWNQNRPSVKDVVEKGVKLTNSSLQIDGSCVVEDVIQNGVRNTFYVLSHELGFIEDTIQNGVKHIEPGGYLGSIEMKGKIVHQFESPKQNNEVEDTIQNGVKETKYCELHSLLRADHIIRDGIKETHWRRVDNHPTYLDRIIKN
jgi:hypothetical protein